MKMRFAVYGTLREGFGNHRALLQGKSTFVGTFKTREQFTMRASGFPVIQRNDVHPTQIVVEVYEVTDPAVVDDLDALEGHPNWYKREVVELVDETDEIAAAAWIYVMPGTRYDWEVVPSGDFSQYWHGKATRWGTR